MVGTDVRARWTHDTGVYALVSVHTRHFYVGKVEPGAGQRTFGVRAWEHFQDARGSSQQRVHVYAREWELGEFLLIPLLTCATTSDAVPAEKRLIRLLQPRLNVQHARGGEGAMGRRRFAPRDGSVPCSPSPGWGSCPHLS